jgi:hypothetical protein
VTPLAAASGEARRVALEGDDAEAERILKEASQLVGAESDREVLLDYAAACRDWGPAEAEEAALRATLRGGRELDVVERLLDVLQAKLNDLKDADPEREGLIFECEGLGTEGIQLLGTQVGLRWANLIRPRGLRRLELAQLGQLTFAQGARSDLEAYCTWLQRNETVPSHIRRANLFALTEVELAEVDLVEGQKAVGIARLERCISTLEVENAPKWWIDRAYSVLERAGG